MKVYTTDKTKVYLATPIETATRPKEEVLAYAEQVAQILESVGCEVYRPWKLHIPNALEMSNHEWGERVAVQDIVTINTCDFVTAIVYDRREATAGVMFELGYAYAREIDIDLVVHESAKQISLMVGTFATHIYGGLENLKNGTDGYEIEVC